MCRTCGPCIWEPGTSYELDEINLILASRVSPAKSGETIERRMLSNIHLAKKTNYANGGHRTIFLGSTKLSHKAIVILSGEPCISDIQLCLKSFDVLYVFTSV